MDDMRPESLDYPASISLILSVISFEIVVLDIVIGHRQKGR